MPPEGIRVDAETSWHPHAFDPRKLPEGRALAADHGDLSLVDLLETQDVGTHLSASFQSLRPHSLVLPNRQLRSVGRRR